LKRQIPVANLRTRKGGSNTELTYVAGETIFSNLNAVFGATGWNREIVELKLIGSGVWLCKVRVTVPEYGFVTEDVGTGSGADQDKAVKEAVTDAVKRAVHSMGPFVGLSLYDPDYVKSVQPELKKAKTQGSFTLPPPKTQ
jgi:recombination DNA repair RAD52 pathway protein